MTASRVPPAECQTTVDSTPTNFASHSVLVSQQKSTGFGRHASTVAASLIHPALLDGIGIAASVGCLVHCAAIPVIALVMPLLADELAMTPLQHRWVMYSSVLLCLSALVIAFRQPERTLFGLLCSSVGVALIATATIGPDLIRSYNGNTTATNAAEVMRNLQADEPTAAETPVNLVSRLNSIDGLVTPAGCLLLISGRFASRRRDSNRCCKPAQSSSAFHSGQAPHHKSASASESGVEPTRIPRPHFRTATLPIGGRTN